MTFLPEAPAEADFPGRGSTTHMLLVGSSFLELSVEEGKAALILGPAGRWAFGSGLRYAAGRCLALQQDGGCLAPRASEKAVLDISPLKYGS